jgi:hypothetical protein
VRRLGSSAATAALLVLGREREGGGGAEVLHAGFILSVMKKPEVGEKRVYRISRKFFGFVVFLSNKNLEKKSSIY